ncbi:MAG: hypothetical protein JSS40_06905 [Proteobacteria bacterium]|nr:hypothetical protein [Pseudomonadota bacterium]
MFIAAKAEFNDTAPASLLGSALNTLAAWRDRLFPSADQLRDEYLSGAVDRVDLEQRLRAIERRPMSFWDAV